jgi:hypothetical protein
MNLHHEGTENAKVTKPVPDKKVFVCFVSS